MYKRLRFVFRYSKAFVAKHYLPLILGSFLSILGVISIPRLISLIPQFRVTRHIGVIGRYTISELPLSIQSKISIGLTIISNDGTPGPGIARSWETSDDGKLVTFHLGPEIRWQDGSKLESQDIQYSYRGAQIEYPDSSTIVFKLQDPYSPLPSLVSKPIFKQTSNRFSKRIVGIGSYKIASYIQKGGVLDSLTLSPVLAQNDLPLLTYHFYSSPQQARTAFKLGAIHEIAGLTELSDLQFWPNTNIISDIQMDRYVGIFFNTQDPILTGQSGKNLRLALAYSLQKPDDATRAAGPISSSSWAYNPDIKKYDYDLARAKDLLSKVEKMPDLLTIRTLPAYIEKAEGIKRQWEELGLNIEIISQSELPSEFQIALVAQAIPIDPDQYIYWHSTENTTNITKIKNPRIDKLLEDGRRNWNQEERKNIYYDFQKYLVEEVPAVFLYHPSTFTVTRS